jgi:hypothetical protein
MIAHLIAAIVLYRERLFLDASYYFFHVVNEESFRIEHQRLILAVSQLPLLLGVKIHLKFHYLLLIYSVTPVAYTSLLLFITLYFFRSLTAAWMVMFCTVCGSYFLYFCPMYEVSYATVIFGFLWFLTDRGYYQGYRQMLIYTLLLALCLFGYPIIAIGCLALLTYLLVFDKRIDRPLMIIYGLMLLIWFIVKYFFISDYERGNVTLPAGHTREILLAIFSLKYCLGLIRLMFTSYLIPSLAVLVFVSCSVWYKKYKEALWSVSWLVIILIIVNVKAHAYMINTIHNERSYLILIPVCLAPLLFRLCNGWSTTVRTIFVLLFMLSASYESVRIWQHSSIFTRRIHQIDHLSDEYFNRGCTSAAINFYQFPDGLNEWSSGLEGFILSSAHGRSIIMSDIGIYNEININHPIDKKHFLLRTDEVMSKDSLNNIYFKLDTTGYCF